LCVLCGRTDPDSHFRFRASRVGWDQILTLSWAIGSRPRIEAPACAHCATRLRRHRLAREMMSWVILLPAAFVILYALHQTGMFNGSLRPWRRWIAGGVILAAFVPYLIWEAVNPPRLDATARGKAIGYEFADAEYAALFARMNR
jgi:hypothetical protein